MVKKIALSAAFLGLFGVILPAQTPADSTLRKLYPEEIERQKVLDNTKVIYVDSEEGRRPSQDSVRSLINRFYVDQFRHFQDPKAPYFMFMTKDASLAMGIGGKIAMRGVFDWKDVVPANGFAPCTHSHPRRPDSTAGHQGYPFGHGTVLHPARQ